MTNNQQKTPGLNCPKCGTFISTSITELLSAAVFGLIVFSLPLPNFFVTCLALMGVIAFSGSTHDIAGDGMYMQQLDASTQSVYSGWQGAFYNLAKVLANGGERPQFHPLRKHHRRTIGCMRTCAG